MSGPRIVVKVGGSLFDWPDLGERLCRWLAVQEEKEILLVPGGGPTADVIRDCQRQAPVIPETVLESWR